MNPFAIFQNAYIFKNQSQCWIEGDGLYDRVFFFDKNRRVHEVPDLSQLGTESLATEI